MEEVIRDNLQGLSTFCSFRLSFAQFTLSKRDYSFAMFVSDERHEFSELSVGGDLLEQPCRQIEPVRFKSITTFFQLLQLFGNGFSDEYWRDAVPVIY